MKSVACLAALGALVASLSLLLWPPTPAARLLEEAPPARDGARIAIQSAHAPVPHGIPGSGSDSPGRMELEQLAARALHDASQGVRVDAVHELGERPESRAREVLEQALHDASPVVRHAAIDALTLSLRPDAETALVRALANPDPAVRSLAAESLAMLRSGDDSLAPRETLRY